MTDTKNYKLKTCIVQTINSAYKGSLSVTQRFLLENMYTVDMKHNWSPRLGDVTDTEVGVLVTCMFPHYGIKKNVF